jgi:acyl carrier protein
METTPTTKYLREVRDFVINSFLFGDPGSLQDDTSFMEGGIIDSTGILELVAFLDSTYGIKVLDAEMVPENLDSVSRVAAFVARKLAPKPAAVVES